MNNVLLTTTDILQNKDVEYVGLVSAEMMSGANAFKDFEASVKNFFGGRIYSYEEGLIKLKKEVNQELILRAKTMDSRINAIIGIKYEFLVFGQSGSAFAILASGTAVIYK